MKTFFDVLIYITCIVSAFYLAIALKRFPSQVEKIDLKNNIKNKPPQKFLENSLVFIELKTALPCVGFFAIALISYFCGSAPRDFANINGALIIPLLFIVVAAMFAGGMLLGNYFLKVAQKYNVYEKTNDPITARTRSGGQLGMGVLTTFYFSLTLLLTFIHLFYICGWL